MEPALLQQELLEFMMMLQNITALQFKELTQFVSQNSNPRGDGFFGQLQQILTKVTPNQVEELVALSTITLGGTDQAQLVEQKEHLKKDLEQVSKEHSMSVSELEEAFNLLMQLFYLQNLLQSLSILQLMKLFDILPSAPLSQQQQLFQQIQLLLGQVQPEALVKLQQQVIQSEPGTEQQTLVNLLNLPFDHFQLYQPLRVLLQLDIEELLKLQDTLPKLHPVQTKQLLLLLQLQPFDVLEFKNLFTSFENMGQDLIMTESITTPISAPVQPPPPTSEKKISLQIVEQPPERSVYKRNLKPNPMVMVTGEPKLTGNLFVSASIVRCDTWSEEAKYLTGNKPEKVTTGRVVTFRKLKVMTTSHQQQETLFCLKFELRRYINDEQYEVLDSIFSNPICVLSHSTQMKPAPSNAPNIIEVVPAIGPSKGGTRVAIIGNNFVDSPAARIRFDQTEVMPIFHGTGTLICHTPEHQPGKVTVKVCNSNKKWSDTGATFTYDDSLEYNRQPVQEPIVARQPNGESITEAAWRGGIDSVRIIQEHGSDVNAMDNRGFTALHYASAQGFSDIVQYLLDHDADINIKDKCGATSLLWACVESQEEVAQLLLDYGANVNSSNDDGLSPLHITCCSGNDKLVALLLESGAVANTYTLDGETPLHFACAYGNEKVVRLLVKYGAYVNAVDHEGESPLHWAVREGQTQVIPILLENGCLIDTTNEDMETALHLATMLEESSIVNVLLNVGAFLNTQDLTGDTPLHDAVASGDASLVGIIIKQNPLIDIRDKEGNTPLHIASQLKKNDIARLLLDQGANFSVKNLEGKVAQQLMTDQLKQLVESLPKNDMASNKRKTSSVEEKSTSKRFLSNNHLFNKYTAYRGDLLFQQTLGTPFVAF